MTSGTMYLKDHQCDGEFGRGGMDVEMNGWQLRVVAGGDVLRNERLTRGLRDELNRVDGVTAGFVPAKPAAGEAYSKGVVGDGLLLWVSLGAVSAKSTAQVLVTLVQEWCARDRHRRVEFRHNGSELVVSGQSADIGAIIELLSRPGDENTDDTDAGESGDASGVQP